MAVTALGGLAAHGTGAKTIAGDAAADGAADASDQFVVHVRDARTGQIDVFRGTRQVRLHDRDLARLLDRVSRG
ncbi:MAG: hypothetical protein ACR2FU_17050 [Streptosporangiaceae bacterium]